MSEEPDPPARVREHRESSEDLMIISEKIVTPRRMPTRRPPPRAFPDVSRAHSQEVIDLDDDLPPPALSLRSSMARDVLLEEERRQERESTVRTVRLSSVGSSNSSDDNDSVQGGSSPDAARRIREEIDDFNVIHEELEEREDVEIAAVFMENRPSEERRLERQSTIRTIQLSSVESSNSSDDNDSVQSGSSPDAERRIREEIDDFTVIHEELEAREAAEVASGVVENRPSEERRQDRESIVRTIQLSSAGSSNSTDDNDSVQGRSTPEAERRIREQIEDFNVIHEELEAREDAEVAAVFRGNRSSHISIDSDYFDDADDEEEEIVIEDDDNHSQGNRDVAIVIDSDSDNDVIDIEADDEEGRCTSRLSQSEIDAFNAIYPGSIENYVYIPRSQRSKPARPEPDTDPDEDDWYYEDNDVFSELDKEKWEEKLKKFKRRDKTGIDKLIKLKMETRLELRKDQDDVRPVLFRRQPTPELDDGNKKKKMKRTTHNAYLLGVRQYHKATTSTPLEEIPVAPMCQTIEEYLNRAKLYMPPSEKLGDTFVCTSVEHENHIKIFHFGKEMKKNSSTQKQMKIQKNWWNLQKKRFRRDSETLANPLYPCLDLFYDGFIYGQHYSSPNEQTSLLQKILPRFRSLINKRRTTNDVIRDSSYFVREFFLPKTNISLRITTASELMECYPPPTMLCGYFPSSATTEEDQEHYLAERFEEAQAEYNSLTYRSIAPPAGYSKGSITSEELYQFHKTGRHIHGFFVVWEANKIDEKLGIKKRYLVDMFNLLRFPLYADYKNWSTSLRVSFDKVTLYNLHLAETIRCNRPVFDVLAESNTLFQPFSLDEMLSSIKINGKDPVLPTKYLSKRAYFVSGLRLSNQNFLSAFTMIIGGSKVLHRKKKIRKTAEFHAHHETTMDFCITDKKARGYEADAWRPVQEMNIIKPFGRQVETSRIRNIPLGQIDTRLIVNIPRTEPEPPPPPPARNTRNFMVAFSRTKLIDVRADIYGFEYPERPPRDDQPPPPKKKGRKKKDPLVAILREHKFDEKLQASDIESDFEGYNSDKEVMEYGDRMELFLKRSTSTDSIFLDYTYQELMLNRLSSIHNQKVPRKPEAFAKRKWRKISRISKARTIRKNVFFANKDVFTQKNNCYHRILPITKEHAFNTKTAMRNPINFARFDLPRVYEKGEVQLVNDVYDCLASMVNDIEAGEIASTRGRHRFQLFRQDSITERRKKLAILEPGEAKELPTPEYCSVEMLVGQQIYNREMAETVIKQLRASNKKERSDLREERRLKEEQEKRRHEEMLKKHIEFEAQRIRKLREEALEEFEENKKRNKKKNDKKAQKKKARQNEKNKEKEKENEKDKEKEKEKEKETSKKKKKKSKTNKNSDDYAYSQKQAEELKKRALEKERLEREKLLREREEREKREAERLAQAKAAKAKAAEARAREERYKQQRLAEKLRAEKEQAARLAKKKEEEEERKRRLEEQKKAEEEKAQLARLKKVAEELQKQKLEKQRREAAKKAAEEAAEKAAREAAEKAEKEAAEKEAAEKAAAEKAAAEKAAAEKAAAVKAAAEKAAAEKAAAEKAAAEQAAKEAAEKAAKEAAEKAAKEAAEKAEREAAKRAAKEAAEKEAAENRAKEIAAKAAKDAAEKAAKAAAKAIFEEKRRKKIAAMLPDEQAVYLQDVAADLSKTAFRVARHYFKNTNLRGLMLKTNEQWTKKFLKECKMKDDFVFKTLYSMVEEPYVKVEDSFQNLIFTNFTKCFKYTVVAPLTREWQFEFNEHLLNYDYVNRILIEDDLDYSNVLGTPKNQSCRQSVQRTPAGLFSTPLRNTPGENREVYALMHRSQEAHKKEVNTSATFSFAKKNAEGASIVISVPRTAHVTRTFHAPLATSTPKRTVNSQPAPEKRDEFKTPTLPRTGNGKRLSFPMMSRTPQLPKIPEKTTVEETSSENADNQSLSNTDTSSKGSEKSGTPERMSDMKAIWRLATYFNKEKMSFEERMNVLNKLENVLSRSILPPYRKACWSFGIIPVLCHFATGMLADVNTVACRKSPDPIITEETPEVAFVIEKLRETSLILAEASNSDKSAFRACLHENGFEFSKIAATKVLNAIGDILLNLDIRKLFIDEANPKHIFCEVVKELGEQLLNSLKKDSSLKEEEIYLMSMDQELTSNAVLGKPHWESFVRKSAKTDTERVFRVRSLYLWFESMAEYGAGMTAAVEKLFSRMALKMAGADWRAMERALMSAEREVDLNDADLTGQWAELSTIHEETIVVNHHMSFEEKQKQRLKRKREAEIEAQLPSKLPRFRINFVDVVWRTIERTFNDLSGLEWDTVPVFKSFKRGHKRGDFKFHMLMQNRDTYNQVGRKKLIQLVVENNTECRKNAEDNVFSKFEHEVLEEKVFKRMAWNIGSKPAIEFFTDLGQYKNDLGAFRDAVSDDGFVDFNFKVYKHHWFMGSTLPKQCQPDSHEDLAHKACGGCTHGEVVLIHNCTCEHFDPEQDGGACHVTATPSQGPFVIVSLVGRFVCKHGPNSTLMLDAEPVGEATFTRSDAEYNEYPAQLRIVSAKKMHKELNRVLGDAGQTDDDMTSDSEDEENDFDSSRRHLDRDSDFMKRAKKMGNALGDITRKSLDRQQVTLTVNDDMETPQRKNRKRPATSQENYRRASSAGELVLNVPQETLDNEIYRVTIGRIHEENRKSPKPMRPKSVERAQKGRVTIYKERSRSASFCDFLYLEKYAGQKINHVANVYNNENRHHNFDTGLNPLTLSQINELRDLSNMAAGVKNVDDDQCELLFTKIMTIGPPKNLQAEKADDDTVLEQMRAKMPVVLYKGAPNNPDNFPLYEKDHLIRGNQISLVMDEYYKFQQFKADILFEANLMIKNIDELRTRETRNMRHLFESYNLMFKFNLGLFEHIMEVIAKHVFNPPAVYEAETTGKIDRIVTTLKNAKASLHMVKNALFNLEPLRRQCTELSQLQNQMNSKQINEIAITLAKFVIERIRAPLDLLSLPSQFSTWLNSVTEFCESTDLMMFSIKDTRPSKRICDEFQRKIEKLGFPNNYDCNRKFTNHRLNSSEFYNIMFNQSQTFFDCLTSDGPRKRVDPYMKAFYEQKMFRRMHKLITRQRVLTAEDIHTASPEMNALLISAIVSSPKLHFDINQEAFLIDNYYQQLMTVPTEMHYVEPSNIGTIFVTYENHLFFSVVQEERIHVNPAYAFPNLSCVMQGEATLDVVSTSGTILLAINEETNILSMVYKTPMGRGKNDRLELEPLDGNLVYFESTEEKKVDWVKTFEIYVVKSHNSVIRILDYLNGKEVVKPLIYTTGNQLALEKKARIADPRERPHDSPDENLVFQLFRVSDEEDNTDYYRLVPTPRASRARRNVANRRRIGN